MNGKAVILTAFDPFFFRGGIETYTLQIIDRVRRQRSDFRVFSLADDARRDRGFHNNYLGRRRKEAVVKVLGP
jgi:hypothetical protein